MVNRKKVCFFAKVKDREVLERIEFYNQDLTILKKLGYEVHIAASISELVEADVYFVWWWTWAIFPVLFARAQRKPVVITGTINWHLHSSRNCLHQKLIEASLRLASANVFVSQHELALVTNKVAVANPQYSPHIIDESVYQPSDAPKRMQILSVAFSGRISAKRKCLREIIDVAVKVHKEFKNVEFIIVGAKGDAYQELKAKIDELWGQDFIKFRGVVSKDEKIELMQTCILYLSPSRFEGFGLAILEAMACGAAIVSSPVGAVPEVVGEAGMLIDGTDVEAIAGAVCEYLNDPIKLEKSRAASITRAQLFIESRRLRDLERILGSFEK